MLEKQRQGNYQHSMSRCSNFLALRSRLHTGKVGGTSGPCMRVWPPT